MDDLIKNAIEAVHALVNAPSPWREKYEAILAEADDERKSSLREFASWFDD